MQKADGNMVVLDLGKLEGVMPLKEQVPTENYHVNDKIRAYVLNVERGLKGAPQVTVSRACADFVRKLFELEIPEIYEGVIEIKGVARNAGSRSKVAVYSPNENIDPVGSCVGQKGIRIQNIINELHGEKIDVIEWNEDASYFYFSCITSSTSYGGRYSCRRKICSSYCTDMTNYHWLLENQVKMLDYLLN